MDECVAAKRRHNAVETEGRSYGVSRMHSPPCKGGVDATSRKWCEATLFGADGVVAHKLGSGNALLRRACVSDHPVCAEQWTLRDFFLTAHPPLLCKEGNAVAR